MLCERIFFFFSFFFRIIDRLQGTRIQKDLQK
jgi:hypothetical protein